MKKYFFVLFGSLVLAGVLLAAVGNSTSSLTPGATSIGAVTTNVTKGAAVSLLKAQNKFSIWISDVSYAATTNGVTRYFLEVSPDGTIWSSALTGNLILTVTNNGVATNTVYGVFDSPGIAQVRWGATQNTGQGTRSNITAVVGWPQIDERAR